MDETQTIELMFVVDNDKKDGCDDYFSSASVHNADETKGLLERTSWRVKGRYVTKPINKPSRF